MNPRQPGWVYWTCTAVLFAFSILAFASIGPYLILIPIAMIAGGVVWKRPWIQLGILAGTISFLVLSTLVMSWSCSSTTAVEASTPSSESQAPLIESVECRNMVGMPTHSGGEAPSEGLRLLALAAVGIGIGVGVSRLTRKRSEAPSYLEPRVG